MFIKNLRMKYRHHFPGKFWERMEAVYENETGERVKGSCVIWDKDTPQVYGVVFNSFNDTGQTPDMHGAHWYTIEEYPLDFNPDEGPIAA